MIKIFIFLLFILILPLSNSFSEENTDDKKGILIVSDKDGLEWNVADYLESYFIDKGYKVNNILISECTKNDYACHGVVIMMNVLKDNKIPSLLLEKMQKHKINRSDNNQETIFFISTITGEEWQNQKKIIDGITSASEMDDAEPIAKRIIENIEAKLKM